VAEANCSMVKVASKAVLEWGPDLTQLTKCAPPATRRRRWNISATASSAQTSAVHFVSPSRSLASA
jgi:hypothetical protein